MSYTIGLDGGSTYLKGALLKDRQVVETMVCSTGIDNNGSAGQMLGQLCQRAVGRIAVMAGGGVKRGNIPALYEKTGITAYHTTGRKGPVDSGMVYRKTGVSMGLPSLSEYELWQTDEEEFRSCAEIVHSLGK